MGIRVWKNVVRKGDVVVDATCGNGYDTLAMARLVADDTRKGCVLAMDLQKDALESTSSLLDRSLTADEVLFSCSSSDHIPTTDFAINYIDHFCILIILGMFCSNCNSFKKLQPFPPHNAYIYVRKTCS